MPKRSPILYFIKAPVAGRVKSRLAASLDEFTALELYRAFVLDGIDALSASGHEVIICFDPPDAAVQIADWLGRNRTFHPQEGTDLGDRMEQAFRFIFSTGASYAILIGSDFPDLPPSIIDEAFNALEHQDAVIGPAFDGGYYLIGFRSTTFRAETFNGIPWSTEKVFAKTLKILSQSGARIHLLPPWRDVDTIDDLLDLYERNRGTDFERSRTMPLLRKVYDTMI